MYTTKLLTLVLHETQTIVGGAATVTHYQLEDHEDDERTYLLVGIVGASAEPLPFEIGQFRQFALPDGSHLEIRLLTTRVGKGTCWADISTTRIEKSSSLPQVAIPSPLNRTLPPRLSSPSTHDLDLGDNPRSRYEHDRTCQNAIDLAEAEWGIPDPRLIDDCWG